MSRGRIGGRDLRLEEISRIGFKEFESILEMDRSTFITNSNLGFRKVLNLILNWNKILGIRSTRVA